jgi:putative transcriptional regulator
MKGGKEMPISYSKLFALLKEKGYSQYRIRKENLMGQATLQKLREGGDIDTRTIKKICAWLDCQPGDIMEYVKPEPEESGIVGD